MYEKKKPKSHFGPLPDTITIPEAYCWTIVVHTLHNIVIKLIGIIECVKWIFDYRTIWRDMVKSRIN